MMDITEPAKVGRRYEVAQERVDMCGSYIASIESHMSDLRTRLDMLNHWITHIGSGYAKARLQVLRDEALHAFATAERHLICAREEFSRAQRMLELLDAELSRQVDNLTIPQPTTHKR
ncbi:hypothetical protein [Candidatus Southlakia epibionticum]|uniref:WXG100 family type VII secretion target n=1 Tax=Candidatus Southlakia epibionticum TaxID=3043284 RepID=A0ABY8X035_9BACT|nr:hypothetical protein SEML1_0539 [Candidatus Saccharimonadaceae bacterium ML1]